ncbi:DUF2568 domain-containing protein [Granulicoccus phenolivorans]|uniref:DUF2568 domain-containing protein n=1 Tax=Granulicoccus phenolivorans TaxID=266854 RepID=UPI0004078B8F|nr:DUF2568 domain-containing protein [Granulicoccus phenolivorans]
MFWLTLVFLAELGAWAAIGVATSALAGGGVPGGLLGVAAAAVAIIGWAFAASPRSRAPGPVKVVVKVVVFGAAVVLLFLAGWPIPAAVLALIIVVAHVGVARTAPTLPGAATPGAAAPHSGADPAHRAPKPPRRPPA